MQDALISVRFQGYCLQIRMPLNSQILDVVQILKENDFLPAGVPNENLSFYTKNKKAVKGKDMVSSLINKNQKESNCELLIQMNGSKAVSQQRQEPQQNSANKFLKRISICLKKGEYNILLSARQKGRFESSTAESLASIGQSFRDAEKQKNFYKQTLGIIKGVLQKDQTQDQFKKIRNQYQDFINFQQIQNASKICSKISQLIKKQQLLGRQRNSLTEKIEEYLSVIETLKQQTSLIQNVNIGKINNLENQISVKNSQNASIKSQLTTLKLQIARISQQLNAQKSKLQNLQEQKSSLKQNLQKSLKESEQLKISLQDQRSKVNQLTRQLHQKARQIQQKENQIKKIKAECNDEEVLQYIKILSKPSSIQISTIKKIEDILTLPDLAKSLKEIISNQMRKQIQKIIPLFSYDQNTQQNFSFEENSIKTMNNKQSLLFIVRSQTEDKIFGAFTQEKYESDPCAYGFQEFHGVSFLFSLIDHKIEYFKNIDGENTIIYDPNYLVFGSEDLMLNYRRNRCLSIFASGKQSFAFQKLPASSARGINSNNDINMRKKLISDQGRQECNVLQYCVFEVQFNAKK